MKTLSILVAMLLISGVSCAQTLQIGIKGGLNLSDIVITNYINPDAEDDFKVKAGMHAGIFSTVDVAERFYLCGELLYSNKGVYAGDRINLHYINLPLLVQYRLGEKFLAEFGPEFGYMITAVSGGDNVNNTWNNRFDIGLDLGLQYDLTDRVAFVLRYGAGFATVARNIDDHGTNYLPGDENVKYQNRVLQFSLRYTITEIKLKEN